MRSPVHIALAHHFISFVYGAGLDEDGMAKHMEDVKAHILTLLDPFRELVAEKDVSRWDGSLLINTLWHLSGVINDEEGLISCGLKVMASRNSFLVGKPEIQ
ncbi:unnamed protein product [Calypogeia fissa]